MPDLSSVSLKKVLEASRKLANFRIKAPAWHRLRASLEVILRKARATLMANTDDPRLLLISRGEQTHLVVVRPINLQPIPRMAIHLTAGINTLAPGPSGQSSVTQTISRRLQLAKNARL